MGTLPLLDQPQSGDDHIKKIIIKYYFCYCFVIVIVITAFYYYNIIIYIDHITLRYIKLHVII